MSNYYLRGIRNSSSLGMMGDDGDGRGSRGDEGGAPGDARFETGFKKCNWLWEAHATEYQDTYPEMEVLHHGDSSVLSPAALWSAPCASVSDSIQAGSVVTPPNEGKGLQYIKKQHLHTRGAETDNRGTAQYGGMTSGAKPSTGALKQRRRPQQQRAQPGQAAEATGQAQQGGAERGAVKGPTAVTTRIGCTQPSHV